MNQAGSEGVSTETHVSLRV